MTFSCEIRGLNATLMSYHIQNLVLFLIPSVQNLLNSLKKSINISSTRFIMSVIYEHSYILPCFLLL